MKLFSAPRSLFSAVSVSALVALSAMPGFAIGPVYSITDNEATGTLTLSPDLAAISTLSFGGPNPAIGPHDLYITEDLNSGYNISKEVYEDQFGPSALARIGAFPAVPYPPIISPAEYFAYSDVEYAPYYGTDSSNPQLPNTDIMAEITAPDGSQAPLYFYVETGTVPDNTTPTLWLLGIALTGLYGLTRFTSSRTDVVSLAT
jgi:hypothetical protein